MSWCTVAEVVELISAARLRGDVDATTRKAADLRFIDVCTGAINAGDVLMQIATEASAAPGLRLNAIFAAQPLITPQGWSEGRQFSDHSAVKSRLLQLTAHSAFTPVAKVDTELLRSLAKIVALEFPTEEWQQWLQACTCAVAASDSTAAAKLLAVIAESHRSYPLWSFLAGDVTGFLLQAQVAALPQRTEVLRCFLELMRRRPRPSAEHEVATATNCVLLSPSMRYFVMSALAARVEEARLSGASSAAFVADCTVTFAVASRLVADAEAALTVFHCSSFFLAHLQDTAARAAMDEALSGLAEQLLECLLSTLQLFPEVASSDIDAGALLTCLIHFMIEPDAPERGDAAELAAELLDFFLDDEAVPLGCGSGDVAHLAGAVLELFLEHNPAQRTSAVVTLNAILESTPHMDGTLADAVALALRSVSRVYEAGDAVVVDALEAATQATLLTQVSQLLLRTTDPHARAMLMDALTHCFYGSCNEDLCRQLVGLLHQLHTTAAAPQSNVDEGCAACVRCACVYEAGRLVEELRTRPWCGSLLGADWVALAVKQLAAGNTLGVFCAASTLCTLLCVSPTCAPYLCANTPAWERGLEQLCRHATVRGVAVLVTLALKHIAGVAASPSAAQAHACQLATASCAVAMRFCESPSPSRHLVLRSLLDFVAAHTRVCLRSCGCSACAPHLAALTSPLLADPLATELLQDEASCRGFATAVTLRCLAFSASRDDVVRAACGALLHALRHALQHSFSSQTISCVSGHLALVVTLQPALLDEATTHILHALFDAAVDLVSERKGLNYGGVAFLLSLVFLRHPEMLVDAAGALSEPSRATQRAFGWWLSLAPFMDAVQFPYFAAACCRVMDVAGGSSARLGCCQHFLLPSLHVKKLPPRPFTDVPVRTFMTLAWADLERRYGGTSKPQVLDKELQQCVAGVEQHYTALCGGNALSGSSAAALLRATAADTIAAFLSHLSLDDGGEAVGAARHHMKTLPR